MATGASDHYWDRQRLPSAFKHSLLDKYMPQFAGMTGSKTTTKRVVFLDGYAGRGRYRDGSLASAGRIMRIAQQQAEAVGLGWTCFFVEKEDESADALQQVISEYVRQGVDAQGYHGDTADILDRVLASAGGCPLFLFLDPCGLGLSYNLLVPLLTENRKEMWPPTEVLLNFSLEAVRRIGGHVASPRGTEATMRRLDDALGGSWWREPFRGGVTDDAVDAVVSDFRRNLAADTGTAVVSAPVKRAPAHRPVYHLVFGTRSQHGLWAFGDSVARATQTWWDSLEEVEAEEDPDALFTRSSTIRPSIETIEHQAEFGIANNLARLLQQHARLRVVDHTIDVYGDYYGQVREATVRRAIKLLHKRGQTPSEGKGPKVRDLTVLRP